MSFVTSNDHFFLGLYKGILMISRLFTASFLCGNLRLGVFSLLLFIPVLANAEGLQNQLKDHPAPYLALHGDDPVAWQPWGEVAVEYAREHNKILYLSVGYFACHWCHVMQQESYKDEKIARFINENFVAVKVDRELEPALDRRLMNFTQRIIGRGGWPLNVFIAPNGHPVYSLLYAPPEQFMQVLQRMHVVWQDSPDKVLELIENETVTTYPEAPPELNRDRFSTILGLSSKAIMGRADTLSGGFGQQQKFPSVPQLQYLLKQYAIEPNDETREFLDLTLTSMATYGLNDHLIGGFFRYSVDSQWSIPHFEKMLNDNANMASLYLQAAQVLQQPAYADIARKTLDFMENQMLHKDGALVSSFSAVDDKEIEGGSYLWKPEEVKQLLSVEEAHLALSVWDLDRPLELPAGNHIRYVMSLGQYAEQNKLQLEQVYENFEAVRKKLLAARKQRSLPVDDKLLAGWNGLALTAFIQGAQHFPNSSYKNTAMTLRNFLVEKLWDGEALSRSSAKGNLIGAASLEDYAYVSRALFHWADYTHSAEDHDLAMTVAKQGWKKFYRNNAWYQGDDTLLAPISGEEILSDSSNAAPSSILISTSLDLAAKFSDENLRNQALSALNRGERTLARAGFWYVSQLDAVSKALN